MPSAALAAAPVSILLPRPRTSLLCLLLLPTALPSSQVQAPPVLISLRNRDAKMLQAPQYDASSWD